MISGAPYRTVGRFGYAVDPANQPGTWTLNTFPMPSESANEINQQELFDGTQPPKPAKCVVNGQRDGSSQGLFLQPPPYYEAVSYTHLTLPTILLV